MDPAAGTAVTWDLVAALAVADGHVGHTPAHPSCTPLQKFGHSPPCVKTSKSEPLCQIFETFFFATPGTTEKGAVRELNDLLESRGVSVWFSEKDVLLGATLLREIDKGLAKSRVGLVLVTPSLLKRLAGEGIADKELSALLARDLLVPIVHDTTYETLREVSPLLGSRSGLSTAEDTMTNIAEKLAELVTL